MRERGAATVYAAGTGLFLMLAGLAVALKAGDIVSEAEARNAADLAALAGAMRASYGEVLACARASEIAGRNGATISKCTLSGFDLTVTVQMGPASATARAGPLRSAG